MRKFRMLLYLLQLEEYQTDRFYTWLANNSIENLEERKDHLHWTTRMILTFVLSFLTVIVWGTPKGIGVANKIIGTCFRLIEIGVVYIAKVKLRFYPNLIKIAITGSYGKTTFKEMLSWVLARKFNVLKTKENYNTHLGIAKMIIKELNKKHQILIVEMAAYQQGDIKTLCQLVNPNIGIITSVGWMHLERFGTLDNIRQTKYELADFIKNKDLLFTPSGDHQIIDFEITCMMISQKLKLSRQVVLSRIKNFKVPKHRLATNQVSKNLTVIDNAYNSNPLGFMRSLKKLSEYKKYQKIVVTPGMIELGDQQDILNRKLAAEASRIADLVVIVGETNKKALASGINKRKTIYLAKNDNLDEKLTGLLRPPTVILLENELPDHYF